MDETIKLANELLARITNEARSVRGPNLKQRLDLLNSAFRIAASLTDVLKIADNMGKEQ